MKKSNPKIKPIQYAYQNISVEIPAPKNVIEFYNEVEKNYKKWLRKMFKTKLFTPKICQVCVCKNFQQVTKPVSEKK